MSQPNPYNEVLVNEFVIDSKSINNVFNYTAFSSATETDMECYADIIYESKNIKKLSTKHKGFYDFQLKTSTQETKFREKNGNCEEKEGNVLIKNEVYTYTGKKYEKKVK